MRKGGERKRGALSYMLLLFVLGKTERAGAFSGCDVKEGREREGEKKKNGKMEKGKDLPQKQDAKKGTTFFLLIFLLSKKGTSRSTRQNE